MSTDMVTPQEGYCPAVTDKSHSVALRVIKGTASFEDRYQPNVEELVRVVQTLRSMGCCIVFTTGVWDLFHIGHAEYIRCARERARELYPNIDHIIVVVGVDSDALTRERKGPARPIVPEEERLRVLSHLRDVDILALQTKVGQLFRIIPHDVRVVSESTSDLPALEEIKRQCQHLVNLPPQAATSTTARVRQLTYDGAAGVLTRIKTLLKEVEDAIG